MSNTNKFFENDYLYIKKIIHICYENNYLLSHQECDMIFNYLYPCGVGIYYLESESQTSQHLEKMEEIKQLLKKYHTIIPKCYYYNYF